MVENLERKNIKKKIEKREDMQIPSSERMARREIGEMPSETVVGQISKKDEGKTTEQKKKKGRK